MTDVIEVPKEIGVRSAVDGDVQRVLVVGGAGYVGSVLVRDLLDRGFRVTVMDALMYGDDGIRSHYDDPRFDVVRGDLRSIEAVVSACRDADAVVHLGALVGDPACDLDERLAFEINLEATRTLAAVARGLGIKRFVFASTCSVYGASDDELHEDSALAPVSIYARTKSASEELLLDMDGNDFCPVILRFGTFFGSSPRARFDLVVNMLVAKAVREGEITIMGGDQWRPFLHVADGAEAVIASLTAPAAAVSHRIFNVGSDGENHTLAEVGQIIASAVPGTQLTIAPPAEVEANYRVSFRRLREELGFVPSRSLLDGVEELRMEIETGAIGDHADVRYSNVKSLASGESVAALQDSEAIPASSGIA
jgi:nucleoside-diphosphate-sugar epimerase